MKRAAVVATLMLVACKGPVGPQGPAGPAGMNYVPSDFAGVPAADFAGTDMSPPVQPQGVMCTPGQSFCVDAAHIATCTLSGADAVLAGDCGASGSATNPSTCVSSGCPTGQAACCRRQNPLWTWNFSAPPLGGQTYVADTSPGHVWFSVGKSCSGAGSALALTSVQLIRGISMCPSDAETIVASFDRTKLSSGVAYSFPTDGLSFYIVEGPNNCFAWTGTARLDSDLPDWSVTINATCAEMGKSSIQVVGTMSGHE